MSESSEKKTLNDDESCINANVETNSRLLFPDYDVSCFSLAKKLLGLQLCHRLDSGEVVKGIIVETECYPGGEDKASQSYAGKKTERNEPMYMSPGTAYVYFTYGMYYCFNISSQGEGAAVLIRALEPSYGLETMNLNRGNYFKGKTPLNKRKPFTSLDLCSGPSKLCMSFAIDKSLNKENMVESEKLWVEWSANKNCDNVQNRIVACARIGIDSAGREWASKPYRFYIRGNSFVSKRDKKAESVQS